MAAPAFCQVQLSGAGAGEPVEGTIVGVQFTRTLLRMPDGGLVALPNKLIGAAGLRLRLGCLACLG